MLLEPFVVRAEQGYCTNLKRCSESEKTKNTVSHRSPDSVYTAVSATDMSLPAWPDQRRALSAAVIRDQTEVMSLSIVHELSEFN